jgi:hypothetical protein
MIDALIFAIAQLAPVTGDNQWRPQDVAYPWPLPADWTVKYWHGDTDNGMPPAHAPLTWACLLDEGTRDALCISTWEVRAGTVCHRERLHIAWEHPRAWYERWRGRSQVYLWAHWPALPQWPEWRTRPKYSWQFDRLQFIPSGPNCQPQAGCGALAHYYIREAESPMFAHGVEWISRGNPGNVIPMSAVDEPAVCRGWLHQTQWCDWRPERPECQPPTQVGT